MKKRNALEILKADIRYQKSIDGSYLDNILIDDVEDIISRLECLENNSKWISAKEKMPEAYMSVLIPIPKGNSDVAYVDEGGQWYSAYSHNEITAPKYWMSLPKPPDEETKT